MFQVTALRRDDFEELFGLDDEALARRSAKRCVADRQPGYPCRVSLQDAEPGERLILVPFDHQPAQSPYRASGPIFVREAAQTARLPPATIPELCELPGGGYAGRRRGCVWPQPSEAASDQVEVRSRQPLHE